MEPHFPKALNSPEKHQNCDRCNCWPHKINILTPQNDEVENILLCFDTCREMAKNFRIIMII